MNNNNTQVSKFLSYALRHEPEKAGVIMDVHGWVQIDDMIAACNKNGYPVNYDTIEEVVATNDKKRFAISSDGEKIRANQGHSIQVDVQLKSVAPPPRLYHGTASKFLSSIKSHGIIPKSRLYVHLSTLKETALKVGKRHGEPIVLIIDSEAMHVNHIEFFLSDNNVWLTKEVDPKYILDQ